MTMRMTTDGARNRDGVQVLGSANMDVVLRVGALPAAGETVLGADAVLRPGGKGANQAVAAALAGARVSFAGCVGDDAHGAVIRDALLRAGVDTSRLATAHNRSTGLAVVLVDPAGENVIAVSPGANHAVVADDVEALRSHLLSAAVLLMQMELSLDVVVRAAEIAASVGTPTLLNLAPAMDSPPELLRNVKILIVNRTEASYLLGADLPNLDSCLRGAAELRKRGPSAVVLTAGADGCVLADGTGAVHVPSIPVEVVDTTGAGDAFVGVLAAEVSCGRSLASAVDAATRAGAAAVQLHGAQLTPSAAQLAVARSVIE